MAVMDMPEIQTLFTCVHARLDQIGIFVFVMQHPCFLTLTDRYTTAHSYRSEAIARQPALQRYDHRPLQEILQACFQSDFVMDGFFETCYGVEERLDVIVVHAKKCGLQSGADSCAPGGIE